MNKSEEYVRYLKSAKWRQLSKRMKERAGHKCAKCGQTSATLEVHHLTYERLGRESETDLIVLCKVCHPVADKQRVVEREARGQAKCNEKGFDTYMTKKFGEGYSDDDSGDDREAFDDWRRGQKGQNQITIRLVKRFFAVVTLLSSSLSRWR